MLFPTLFATENCRSNIHSLRPTQHYELIEEAMTSPGPDTYPRYTISEAGVMISLVIFTTLPETTPMDKASRSLAGVSRCCHDPRPQGRRSYVVGQEGGSVQRL
jgi:hypothetical protein